MDTVRIARLILRNHNKIGLYLNNWQIKFLKSISNIQPSQLTKHQQNKFDEINNKFKSFLNNTKDIKQLYDKYVNYNR